VWQSVCRSHGRTASRRPRRRRCRDFCRHVETSPPSAVAASLATRRARRTQRQHA